MRRRDFFLRLAVSTMVATAAHAAANRGKSTMPAETVATGLFYVTMAPTGAADAPVSAMSLTKTFHGDLDATSIGQMLAVRTPVDGSAGYVAMERVTGNLAGHHGSFALQHSGTMNQGAASLSVTVVPDSGTGDLTGLAGTMDIAVAGREHRYTLRYTLPK